MHSSMHPSTHPSIHIGAHTTIHTLTHIQTHHPKTSILALNPGSESPATAPWQQISISRPRSQDTPDDISQVTRSYSQLQTANALRPLLNWPEPYLPRPSHLLGL